MINIKQFIPSLITKYKSVQTYKENIKKLLLHLDEHEKSVLREFKVQKENQITVSMEDYTVINLLKNNILEQTGIGIAQKNIAGKTLKVKISNIAKKSLTDILIDYPKNENRPEWVSIIQTQKEYDNKMAELMNKIR